jgi:hypothetical protein
MVARVGKTCFAAWLSTPVQLRLLAPDQGVKEKGEEGVTDF